MGWDRVEASPMFEAAEAKHRRRRADTVVVQRTLRVGASDDPLEREADEVADEVMRTITRAQTATLGVPATASQRAVRRSASAGEATDARHAPVARIQRSDRVDGSIGAAGGTASPDVENRITTARGRGKPLPSQVGTKMQRAFGADLSEVRLHDNAESRDLNRAVGAKAFTTQSDIFLGASAPSITSPAGTRLLAHELTHVVQQRPRIARSVTADRAHGRTPAIRRLVAPSDNALALDRASRALAAHKKDRAALMKIVRKGAKSKERRTRNACEWILDGRTKLYALSATGDNAERIAHLGVDPTETETWFPEGDGGAGDLQSGVAMYNPLDLDDQTNVCVDEDDGPSTNGWNGDGYIAIMLRGGRMKEAEVLETLRHEVQHDADKNREKRAAAVPVAGDVQGDATDLAQDFEGYKTEYRAYSYEGIAAKGYNKLSPTKVVTKYGFKWSERQLEVFEQIHAGYDHTQRFWDDSFEAGAWATANPGETEPDGPSDKGSFHEASISANWQSSIEARRQALVDYANPDDEGFNKYDSIRVDDFYQALDAVPAGTSSSSVKPMYTLMWKTGFLGKPDARYILEESPDMRKKMKQQLIGEAYVTVHQALCSVAGVKKATPLDKMGAHKSAVIQTFADALSAVPIGNTDAKHPSVRTLRFKTAKLSKKEAKQVLQHEPKLLNQIDRHLVGQVHADLMQLLQDCLG